MNISEDLGFSDNPFKTTALDPNEEGIKLLAGRKGEVKRFMRRLYNQPQVVTVEGFNGVGKSSIVNVGIYESYIRYIKSGRESSLFIPCIKTFQIGKDTKSANFINSVLIEAAQTISRYKGDLVKLDIKIPKEFSAVEAWLNTTHNKTKQYSGGIGLIQGGYGEHSEINTSKGFSENGISVLISKCLESIFPNKTKGGIVCIIDNLEIIDSSNTARQVIEELRDTMFNVQGLRWIICGSLGIVSSVISSPRLEGLMHDPIKVDGIDTAFLNELYKNRVSYFKLRNNYYLPITVSSFMMLYDILRKNIRNTLKYANDFCLWIDDNNLHPSAKDEKENLFIEWINLKCIEYHGSIKSRIKSQSFKLFRDMLIVGGECSFSDFEVFEVISKNEMRELVKELEAAGLIVSVVDENDRRRKSIQITPKGWFISHHLGV
ncbi:MAG: hypothetical protein AAGF87_07545 [Bacteroidota bacterium]